MATNKNQHFVPRCYLRPFTIDCSNKSINLFNIDRMKFIERAPVKNQCSGNYFYGKDVTLDQALQSMETAYSVVLKEILRPGYKLTDHHRIFLLRFWLLQCMRTDAASRRAIEMNSSLGDLIGIDSSDFKYGIREAVLLSMHVFAQEINLVDDLRVCLFKNLASIPFITSDDPAVFTNRWHFMDKRTKGRSFGLNAAGIILLLPLSPKVLCIGYDGDVYSVPNNNGWVKIRNDKDVEALNQHQFFNCWANIFVNDSAYSRNIREAFSRVASLRPKESYTIHYAVLDSDEGGYKHYRVVDPAYTGNHKNALLHTQKNHVQPSTWPRQLRWRPKGFVFTNGTGIGYIRRAWVTGHGFRKELVRKTK